MQQAIPYRTWSATATSRTTTTSAGGSLSLHSQLEDGTTSTMNTATDVTKLVTENPVIVFGRRGCSMCHVVKTLLLGLGVNPAIFDVDENDEAAIIDELSQIIGAADDGDHSNGSQLQFPAVFVGGRLFGGLDRLISTHISDELVPILREAKALWL